MKSPLVSIVIPVYNGADYLGEAIDSSLAQTYKNIEIVVVNDGSCDNGATEKVALSYGDKIRYFRKENGGVASALNLAIKEMKGEYFSWLSHDDLYYPNKVESQLQAINESADPTEIVFGPHDFLFQKTNTIEPFRQHLLYPNEKLTNSVFPVINIVIHGTTMLIHKSHFERVGVFNEKLLTTQDLDLWFRMLRHQNTIYLEEALVVYRMHDTQASRTIECHNQERQELFMGFMKELTKEEICSMYENEYNFYYQMSRSFIGNNLIEPYNYAMDMLAKIFVPKDAFSQYLDINNRLKQYSQGKTSKICIFGAGYQGNLLASELFNRMVYVDYFSDNDSIKWGRTINDIYCISPEQLRLEKETTLVIVATINPDSIFAQLKLLDFPYVITLQDINNMINKITPLKYFVSLNDNFGCNFISDEMTYLKDYLKHALFEQARWNIEKLKCNNSKEHAKTNTFFVGDIVHYRFYTKIHYAITSTNDEFREDMLRQFQISSDIIKKCEELKEYLKQLSDYKAKQICIFCTGDFGLTLYKELLSRAISIDFFSDNNSQKWGYVANNTYCISPEQLINEKDNILVIVATRTPNDIIAQLNQLNFPYITTKQELDEMVTSIPRIENKIMLDDLCRMDYSSKEAIYLIDTFNQAMFELDSNMNLGVDY
jgi:glycosyltransferase involved in cell wall biosynthesis